MKTKKCSFFTIVIMSIMCSLSGRVYAQTKLYEGSFTTTGTKYIITTGQFVNIPTMSVYVRAYTDRIEISTGDNIVTRSFWKYENEAYFYGDDNYFWSFSYSSTHNNYCVTEASRQSNSIIAMMRTCPNCNAAKYCSNCRGGGQVVGYSGRLELCGICGGSGYCWKCNGCGYY